ncbi:MAG: hypothetical protein IT236_15415 [Bacteroidia bacterium]|nr:hypothetical protein [Bacteroidia bacterium]
MKKFIATTIYLLLFAGSYFSAKANYTKDKDAEYTAIVKAWNDAHNNWHFNDLKKLYAERVLFYCNTVSRDECIGYKTSLATPTKIFIQKIVSEVSSTDFGKGVIKCEFTKEVIIDDKKAEYPAYIVLKEINDSLKIICESDEITDASFGFSLSREMFQANPKGNVVEMKTEATNKSSNVFWYSFASTGIIAIIALAVRRRNQKKTSSN